MSTSPFRWVSSTSSIKSGKSSPHPNGKLPKTGPLATKTSRRRLRFCLCGSQLRYSKRCCWVELNVIFSSPRQPVESVSRRVCCTQGLRFLFRAKARLKCYERHTRSEEHTS